MIEQLAAFAQSEKKLNVRQKDGATARQHFEMARKAGRVCPELIQPEVDKQTRYLWRWFCELSLGRQNNGLSACPISWGEMKAWAELTGRTLNPFEVSAIRAIDWSYLND